MGGNQNAAATLDLREPMSLAARAIVMRLDASQDYRPWFMLRGRGGVPAVAEHASWDLGDMTGRYLEGLILTRRMGISTPAFSEAEGRLGRYLLQLLGPDGLVHDPSSGAIDHSFSQGSALYGLLAWWEDSSDPAVRVAIERLVSGMLKRMQRDGDVLIDPSVKLEQSSGSHLTGYAIYPVIRFYELTRYADALTLAEGLTRWTLADPMLGPDGSITKPLSWEGHIHSWLDTLAGCARTAKHSSTLNRDVVIAKCRAVYDWVRRSNTTDFGWIATFPTHGSSETCAISSALRLAVELAAAGDTGYFNDVERFVRNQVVEAQFREIKAYEGGSERPTPLIIGCFDSQSLPTGHLGTRGGEDVGTVEGCCLNGGMRALALAWSAIQSFDESGVTINLALSMNGPAAQVIGYQPFEGRVDVIPRVTGVVRVRLPDWVRTNAVRVFVNGDKAKFTIADGASNQVGAARPHAEHGDGPSPHRFAESLTPLLKRNAQYVELASVHSGSRVSIRYPLRDVREDVVAGPEKYRVRWKGDVVIGVSGPAGGREPTYQNRLKPSKGAHSALRTPHSALNKVPDTYELQDAARLASMSMLARMDLRRRGQPFFRVYPFAKPPRAEHEKWDDGDMTGRYVEALILARRMTGIPLDPREPLLRSYLASLCDPADGLCYTQPAEWMPRRACMFSQSCAMMGLLAWLNETGSPEARALLDRHVAGLMRIALDRGDHAYFPRYEYDGKEFINDPKDRDAPTWYGGRLIYPLVEYWKLTQRDDVRVFVEKLIRYSVEISKGIKPDGEVVGELWWSHLHSTMDMAAGITEFGRLNGRPELVAWAKRVYDWVGRACTTRYGWVSDIANSSICESCAIASRFRLGLALYSGGAADPFGEIDRHLRNQLLESQFVELDFLGPLEPDRQRTEKATYSGVDRMIRGTFQCWGTANDLIGHEDIEGCGAGGGVQGLALAWNAQSEWRDRADGKELRVHLLFNRRIRAAPESSLTSGTPIAVELWSFLPNEGRVMLKAHQAVAQISLRIPDGTDEGSVRVRRWIAAADDQSVSRDGMLESRVELEGSYAVVRNVQRGDVIELLFSLKEHETVETANRVEYRVSWRGSSVLGLEPRGTKVPLYSDRSRLRSQPARLTSPRYP